MLTATEIACSTTLLLFSLLLFFSFLLFYFGGCDYLHILYGFKLTVLLLQSLDIRIIGRCHHSCYQLVLSFKFRAFVVLGDCGESIVIFRVIVSESKLRFQNPLTFYVNIALAVVQKPSPPFCVCQSCLEAQQQIHWAGKPSRNSIILQHDLVFIFIFISLFCELRLITSEETEISDLGRQDIFQNSSYLEYEIRKGGCKGAATQPGIDKVKDLSPSSAWWQHAAASALERQGAEARGTSRFSIVKWEAWGQFRLLVESLWMGQNCCTGQTTCISKILIRFLNFSCFYFTLRVIFLIDFWNCQFYFLFTASYILLFSHV